MSSSASPTETLLSNQVFREVNHYRNDLRKQDLLIHSGLSRLALEHAEYLRANRGSNGLRGREVSHHGFAARAFKAQMNMGFGQVGENVVSCRRGNAATLVRLWSQSESHDETMKAPYQYTGVGTVVDDDGMVFTVQLFGMSNDYNMNMDRRFTSF